VVCGSPDSSGPISSPVGASDPPPLIDTESPPGDAVPFPRGEGVTPARLSVQGLFCLLRSPVEIGVERLLLQLTSNLRMKLNPL
jgi:hypothetical protein